LIFQPCCHALSADDRVVRRSKAGTALRGLERLRSKIGTLDRDRLTWNLPSAPGRMMAFCTDHGGYTVGLHRPNPGVQESLILQGFLEVTNEWRRGRDSNPVHRSAMNEYSITMDRRNKDRRLQLRVMLLGALTNVRCWRKSGRHLLVLIISQFDPERTPAL
jgi:hypothetical protein